MESQAVLADGGASNGGVIVSNINGLEQVIDGNGLFQVVGEFGDEKQKGNLAEEVLEDLEEYWEDINDRLIISRMVSDSVVTGMVTAVEQEAAEICASKELELARLKECLQSHVVGGGRIEGVYSPAVKKSYEVGNYRSLSCFPNACMKHEKMRDDVCALRNLAREQFERAKKEVEFVRASNSVKRIGSASELVGLGGILQEKQSESWMHVDKMLEYLKEAVYHVCTKVDDILLSSKSSLCELQQERNLTEKLEGVVMDGVLKSLQEEFEDNLWEQNDRYFENRNVNWLEKFNEVSGLGPQLDAIIKQLSMPDTGLVSHGSHDFKHLHHKVFSNHVTPPAPLFGENGLLDADIHIAESYVFEQRKHLSNVQLVDYFNNIITKMKRDHELALQQKTEEYFCLKREYLKQRSSFLTHRKDEEFDVLRKEIPEVILKLEDFLLENERFPVLTSILKNMGKLKLRIDSLLKENCQLRDCLAEKTNEVKCLEVQVSGAAAKSLEHSLSEDKMLKVMENLKSELEDSHIETSLNEDIYICALREQVAQIMCNSEDSCMELLINQEIYDIHAVATIHAETITKLEYEDKDIESFLMQGLSGMIMREAIKDAGQEFDKLYQEDQIKKDIINCLEAKSLEKENELRLEVEEKEKLKEEVLELGTKLKENEKLAMDLSILFSKERKQLQKTSIELCSLREHANQQQKLSTERDRELEFLRSQHVEAMEHVEVGKMEMQKLNQMLDQTKEVLMEVNRERNTALSLAQEMHEKLLSSEAREVKLKMDMKMAVNELSKMFHDFHSRVSEAIKKNILSPDCWLKYRMTTVLTRTELMYKKKLERGNADLQMAETEVDLLGNEVDALLRLLEKIYIALDHYSPILRHYPGITEILELVRRELCSDYAKLP